MLWKCPRERWNLTQNMANSSSTLSLCLHFLQVLQEARDYLFQKINSETLHGANGIKLKILRSQIFSQIFFLKCFSLADRMQSRSVSPARSCGVLIECSTDALFPPIMAATQLKTRCQVYWNCSIERGSGLYKVPFLDKAVLLTRNT